MSKKELMKGNEALAEASIIAGCRYYFGYPITPQNEVPAYMSKRLPEVGGVFVQAESELASINMVYGAAATGRMAMTSSSSPGISLMQEGISYMAGCEMPALIVNVMRGGPGLGNIGPSQADYLQSVKGGGHGDYHLIIFSPSSVQEIVDLTIMAFDYAFKYRIPAMLIFDGILGQMSEPVILPDFKEINTSYKWALGQGDGQNIIRSLFLTPENRLELHNLHLQEKYREIEKEINLYESYMCDDADYLFIAYGSPSRVCRASIDILRSKGVKIGLFRPISLWPFPKDAVKKVCLNKKKLFVVEMAYNQLEQDIALSIDNRESIVRYNKLGGAIFTEEETINFVLDQIKG